MPVLAALRRRWASVSLTARLTTWYVGLLALMLIGVGTMVYVSLGRVATAGTVLVAEQTSNQIRQQLEAALTAHQVLAVAAQALFDSQGPPPGAVASVADVTGSVVAGTSGSSVALQTVRSEGMDAVRAGSAN